LPGCGPAAGELQCRSHLRHFTGRNRTAQKRARRSSKPHTNIRHCLNEGMGFPPSWSVTVDFQQLRAVPAVAVKNAFDPDMSATSVVCRAK